uniref:Uncharacterized protein n=1 Tax=Aegilops tauschii subsp. strangulata TaxID=200361 RepID=A0A453DBB6_AEGTS
PAFVYRISTGDEWAELQRTGGTLGGDLDRSTGCFHLSDLAQVPPQSLRFLPSLTPLLSPPGVRISQLCQMCTLLQILA